MIYLVFIFRDDAGIGFTVPDVRGFTAHAETHDIAKAIVICRDIFNAHCGALIEEGGTLPAPRSLDDLRADPDLAEDWKDSVATMFVPALPSGGERMRVNLSFDAQTLDMIDRLAKARGLTRSSFLAEAARAVA